MRNLLLFFSLIYFICFANSQSINLIDFQVIPDYSKNHQRIEDCIDKIYFNRDTLNIEILTQRSSFSDPIHGMVKFIADTLFIDCTAIHNIDTTLQYDSVKQKYDTIFYFSMTFGMDNNYFSRLTYKIIGFSNIPDNIKFQNRLIYNCQTRALSYDIMNGDTVNLINSNGWKHGKWISTIIIDSIVSTKVKYYSDRQFVEGYIIAENGDTTHCITETNMEMSMPYELCK